MSYTGGVYVFTIVFLIICCVILKDMSYWSHVLLEGMYYRRAYFAVRDVLLGYMFYRRVYLIG